MKIKILSWNVWYKEKPENILKTLRKLDADILCLQELTQTSEFNPNVNIPETVANDLSLNAAFFVAQVWKNDGIVIRDQGNGIFSKYPIRASKQLNIQKSGGNDPAFDDEGRDYIEASIDINDSILTVATTHMSYTHMFEGSLKRDTENEMLLQYIGRDRAKYFFAGDLNAARNSEVVDNIPRKTNLRIASPPYAENTWTTKPFTYRGFNVDSLEYRLDYAFASHDIEIVKTEVVKTDSSDHLPILTTILI